MHRTPFSSMALAAILALFCTTAVATAGTKVLYIDSYHEGYPWSDGITKGVVETIGNEAELKIVRMDTMRNSGEDFKKNAALEMKAIIESWKPDVVIASDDNASKYLIMPYFKNADLPFVFCGVNWDEKVYGYPYGNVTGMVEVTLAEPMYEALRQHAKGDRFGFLAGDGLSPRKEADNIQKAFGLNGERRFVNTFAEWKDAYVELQSKCDIIMMIDNASIEGWDDSEAEAWAVEHTKIPTCTANDWMMPYAALGFSKDASEQGQWAAETALKIANGAAPSSIPMTTNRRGKISINTTISSKLGIRFPLSLVKQATITKSQTMTATGK